ncbi:hypothetical protein BH10PLA1_BH10PLA1_07110 [soil metagenome]
MVIEITCDCGKRYRIDDQFAGRIAACKSCGKKLKVPRPEDRVAAQSVTAVADAASKQLGKIPIEDRPGRLTPIPTNAKPRVPNPALVYLDRVHALRNVRFLLPFLGVLVVTVFALTLLLTSWVLAAGLAVLAVPLALVQIMAGLQKKSVGGDVLPALVIDNDPDLIAILVNLSLDSRKPAWAVKIIKVSLASMADGPAAIGEQLPVAVTYKPPQVGGVWKDVEPVPVAALTRNRADLQRVLASIPKSQWQKLDAELVVLKFRTPGLHRVGE